MPTILLVRHGTTTWARRNRFAGWADAPLSAKGRADAQRAGHVLAGQGLAIDLCHTSLLSRASETLEILLNAMGCPDVPVERHWRLNERHYGSLQGQNRFAMARRYSNEQLARWRRSYRARPPSLEEDDARWQEQLSRLCGIQVGDQPRTESLEDAVGRHRVLAAAGPHP